MKHQKLNPKKIIGENPYQSVSSVFNFYQFYPEKVLT
ncbi:MAG: hypothetical protein KatS3mg027_2171 [Bacteroidia bacterium]|nr:MAG: hypothetical protein KatS3mg027_2171 [Bacteroidia bacterium]